MTSRIIVRPGDPLPDLETVVGCIEFTEQRLQLKTNGSSAHPPDEELPARRTPMTRPHHGVELILLDNAFLPGRWCSAFNFYSDLGGRTVWDLFKALLTDISPATLRTYLLEIEARHPRPQHLGAIARLRGSDGQDLFVRSYPASRVFSQDMLGRIAPLPVVPGLWDMSAVRAALANGQFRQLKAKGGASATELLEELVTKNLGHLFRDVDTGWSTKLDYPTQHVSISRHGTHHSSFTLKLTAATLN